MEKKSPVGRNKTSPPAKPISESSGQQMVCKFCARQHGIEFLIVSGACKSILGLRASEHLQLLTIKNRIYLPWTANAVESGLFTKEDCLSLYNVFSAEGKL